MYEPQPDHSEIVNQIDAWLIDKNAPRRMFAEVAKSLATLSPEEYAERRKNVGKRLDVGLRDLDRIVKKRRAAARKLLAVQPPHCPHICVDPPQNLLQMVKEPEQVLHSISGKYYEQDKRLVHVVYAGGLPKTKNIERDSESVIIVEASHETIERDLDTRAIYVTMVPGEDGPSEVPVDIPNKLPAQIHDRVRAESRDVPFPSLTMVTASPVLLPSGAVHREMFEEGVLYVSSNHRKFPPIPDKPGQDDAKEAMKQFDEVFGHFPFVDSHKEGLEWDKTASYAAVLAGVLSLVARPHLGLNAVPLITVTAPTKRSGKTKIIEAICGAGMGHRPTFAHFIDETELGKQLHPLMVHGDRAICIDNIEQTLTSAKLNILITGGILNDRALGKSEDITLQNHAVLFAIGNNLVIGGDLTSRTLRIDIDPKHERPEARKFEFDPVTRAIERHPDLVTAALVALRAYLLAKASWTLARQPWGGFVLWDQLICGCLTWLGYADPYETRGRMMESDPIRSANFDILEQWVEQYGYQPVTIRDIRRGGGELYEILLNKGQWNGHHAHWILRRLEGQVYGNRRLVRLEGRGRFQVALLNPCNPGADDPPPL